MFQRLEDLEVYQLAEQLADDIWEIALAWDLFAKDTVGKQIVRAADSISVNLSEGYGRYSFKENIQFCYYARGSLLETKNWVRRSQRRTLIESEVCESLQERIEVVGKKLNAFINSMKKQASRPKNQ
ncbi:MAG: four helix bundle protein [Bacteroidota bacterium]|nr:four helix bundle protein [Bacteroidota bacterium]